MATRTSNPVQNEPELLLTTPPVNYTYQPLTAPDAVRVLLLQPSADINAELECETVEYSRDMMFWDPDTTDYYKAMSYAWGDHTLSHQLFCNSRRSFLGITANVDLMLRHMRLKFGYCYLWISEMGQH